MLGTPRETTEHLLEGVLHSCLIHRQPVCEAPQLGSWLSTNRETRYAARAGGPGQHEPHSPPARGTHSGGSCTCTVLECAVLNPFQIDQNK